MRSEVFEMAQDQSKRCAIAQLRQSPQAESDATVVDVQGPGESLLENRLQALAGEARQRYVATVDGLRRRSCSM